MLRWLPEFKSLHVVAAEDHPSRDLHRITYDLMDGTDVDEGVAAFARGLEHINLGWAFAGVCLRLPGIKHLVQILLDGSGLGPRSIPRRSHQLRRLSGLLPLGKKPQVLRYTIAHVNPRPEMQAMQITRIVFFRITPGSA